MASLASIARTCRQYGIASYDDGTLKLLFGPPPPQPSGRSRTEIDRDRVDTTPAKPRPKLIDLALSDED